MIRLHFENVVQPIKRVETFLVLALFFVCPGRNEGGSIGTDRYTQNDQFTPKRSREILSPCLSN